MSSLPRRLAGARDADRLADLVRLRRVRDRIDREYAQPLDVEELARGVHWSAGHLSREFRTAFGEPPYAYLMTRRVERAMWLLRTGEQPVTDVCLAVGCTSLGSFTSRFTHLVGLSPTAYRRLHRPAAGGAELPGCVAKQVLRPPSRPASRPASEPASGSVRTGEARTVRQLLPSVP